MSISIHKAIDRRYHYCGRDKVDSTIQNDCGGSRLIAYESKVIWSNEKYGKNQWYSQGDLLQPLYIIFYKRGKFLKVRFSVLTMSNQVTFAAA